MDLSILLAAVGTGLFAGVLVFFVVARLGAAERRATLSNLGQGGRARGLESALDGAGAALARVLPAGNRQLAALDLSLRLSGSRKTAAQVWAEQLASAMALAGLAGALGAALGLGALLPWAMAGGALAGFALPRLLMIYQRANWHRELERELPDLLDILCVAVSSGSTLEDAMRIASEDMQGELAAAVGRVVRGSEQEGVAVGFRAFADVTGIVPLRNVAHAIWLATESGAPIARVLQQQADYLRVEHRQRIEEASEKLDNQLTIDIGLLIMPAVFVGALAPFVRYIVTETLGSGMI